MMQVSVEKHIQDRYGHFQTQDHQPSPTVNGSIKLYRHEQLGTEVLVHRTSDPNKVFCIGFLTPNDSANGLTHILEHLVLTGSKEYPVANPFFSTVKGSFSTFLNARTFPEYTMYPLGTTNGRELLNLAGIYLDAVFHPLLTPEKFRQEGWCLERNSQGAYVFNGIVYNEMKRDFSSPAMVLYEELCATLFPDTHRGKSSVGEPGTIPQLSHDELIRYHDLHYHPSRARILIHGDLSDQELTKIFDRIEEKIGGFTRSEFEPVLRAHAPSPGARERTVPFPCQPQKVEGPPFASTAWPLGVISSLDERMLWQVVAKVLLAGDSSPLRQQILSRGLAKQLITSGSVLDSLDTFFLVSGKDVSTDTPGEFAAAVTQILADIVQVGLPREEVEAALNQFEFSLREGPLDNPRGLEMLEGFISQWLLGENPLENIDRLQSLSRIRESLTVTPRLLENLIEARLIHNPESASILLKPSHDAFHRAAAAETERVCDTVAHLSTEELALHDECVRRMRQQQQEGDAPELLHRIPSLIPSDLPSDLSALEPVKSTIASRVVVSSAPTGGIAYGQFAFDLSGMPRQLLGYAPLVARLVGAVDTQARSFVAFNREVRCRTGGISASIETGLDYAQKREKTLLLLDGKALVDRSEDLLSLMHEALFTSQFATKSRFVELLDETLARIESSLELSGHSFAIAEASTAAVEQLGSTSLLLGFGQTRFLKDLKARTQTDWNGITEDFSRFSAAFCRNNSVVRLCANAGQEARSQFLLEEALHKMPNTEDRTETTGPKRIEAGERQAGIAINSEVGYIAAAARL